MKIPVQELEGPRGLEGRGLISGTHVGYVKTPLRLMSVISKQDLILKDYITYTLSE